MLSTTELRQLIHHKNLAQWQQLVYDCHNSGMTVKAWCAENGISEKTYYYRQRKVWKATQQQKPEQDAEMPGKLPAIIPCTIPVATTVSAQTPALVLRSASWTVEVNPGCDPEASASGAAYGKVRCSPHPNISPAGTQTYAWYFDGLVRRKGV